MLKVYYKFNVASFKEAEWVKLKEKFFKYFLPHKEEALGLNERCPMDFMAYIGDHFYKAIGLHLEGLRSFTAWIRQGSYYHGLVAQQGHLHECLHLTGVPLPGWGAGVSEGAAGASAPGVSATGVSMTGVSTTGATVAPTLGLLELVVGVSDCICDSRQDSLGVT